MFSWDTWALAVDLRAVLRLVVLSIALVLVAQVLFQRNAPSRRQFLLWAAVLLLVLPWLAGWLNLAIPVGVGELPQWSLEQVLPVWLVWPMVTLSLVGLVRIVLQATSQRRAVMQLPKLQDIRLQHLAQTLLKPLGLEQMPQFRGYQEHSGLPQAPFASSKAHGQVILPSDYQQLDDNRLRAIITHEFVHLARRDDWGRLTMRVLVSVYWFLPWLRKLERDYLDAMEHSCDDRAADFFGPSLSYMEAVVGVVGISVPTPTIASLHKPLQTAAVNSQRSTHPLLQRVMRFGHRREFDADGMRVAGYLLLTLAAGLALVSLQPVAKPLAEPRLLASAGLALPVPSAPPQIALTHTPRVRVTVAQPLPQGQRHTQPTSTISLKALEQPLPVYPGAALRAELEGEVWVDYQIAMDGSVVNPQVVHSAPEGLFENSALATVRRTRYQHLSHYASTPLGFTRAALTVRELRVRQRFRYQLQPSY